MLVAGRYHKPNALGIFPGQDSKGKYAKRCIAFADEYGYTRAMVCTYWAQMALCREFELKQDRDVAEDGAWHDIRGALRDVKISGDCN